MPESHAFAITESGREHVRGDPTLIFPWWSFTKTAIAIRALGLHERGTIDLDAPLEGTGYTPRQLLAHTAGLPDYGALAAYHRAVAAGEDPWPRDRLLGAALAGGPLFAPGEGWAYSNIGYMFAREHLEAATGRSLASLLDEMILRPLGLGSVELATTRAAFSRVHWRAAASYHPGWVYHGCLIGSARDAAMLLRGLVSGQLLGAEAWRAMRAPRRLGDAVPGRPWTEHGYGLGLMIGRMGKAGRAIGHSGGGPFGTCAVYHFPDRPDPVTVACFAEGTDPGGPESDAAGIAARL
ncbi:serine hydrolase domain-containing protein [Amaricoccus solimangrovi]|uniref:Beta-lactamase family protein n=1 Tax=Amaricoccus solimangrovi TaxID=2589815 RepID=A0A501WRT9_9RHOB|nr:serine hydrolase domain-containing protein [Amaricoccus solimangrovi]TPE52078.1 beta-lactamase family protein [Amaricoccus solimangrovi]